ncbi:MAG: Uma2 family endonuclease [Acidobacteriota bacterium]|nr:Uma2 family endonuclease [Acidobacteriota bacterium]
MMNVQSIPQPRRLRFSVDEYYKMIELGMLKDYEKAEIIGGELIQQMTIGDRHALIVDLLTRFFIKNVSNDVRVGVQNPLRISDYNEPEPDLVLSDLTKYDGKRHPRPAEVILVIEVSDATLKYDRDIKLPLYAEAGIEQVWIVNLKKNIIEIHQNPFDDIYQTVKIYKSGETIDLPNLPNLKLAVDEILL